jgi:hypothetical protein
MVMYHEFSDIFECSFLDVVVIVNLRPPLVPVLCHDEPSSNVSLVPGTVLLTVAYNLIRLRYSPNSKEICIEVCSENKNR